MGADSATAWEREDDSWMANLDRVYLWYYSELKSINVSSKGGWSRPQEDLQGPLPLLAASSDRD